MTKRQTLWLTLGGICVVALIVVGVINYKAGPIVDYLCRHRTTIAVLDVHKQRRIILTADKCFENDSRPIYYEVREAGRVVTPTTYFGNDNGDEPHTYTIAYAEDESLVAVTETTATPAETVIMQDFKTGESWPRYILESGYAKQEFAKHKWQGVFDRLQRENPQLPKPNL